MPIPPPPPPRKRASFLTVAMLIVIILMLLCLTVIASLWYAGNKMLTRSPAITVTATAIAPTQAPTNTPTPEPTNTPTPIVIVETATPAPSNQVIVPYTASQIFQDFQAAGIAMSNISVDNSWCHTCNYTPSGGAISWDDYNNSPKTRVEIATFATIHAMQVDGATLKSQGYHGYETGRCMLFYDAYTLYDIQSYLSVMSQYCY